MQKKRVYEENWNPKGLSFRGGGTRGWPENQSAFKVLGQSRVRPKSPLPAGTKLFSFALACARHNVAEDKLFTPCRRYPANLFTTKRMAAQGRCCKQGLFGRPNRGGGKRPIDPNSSRWTFMKRECLRPFAA